MGYLACMVLWKVFQSIELGFLPIGHTHSEIYQIVSTTSWRLRTEDIISMDYLYGVLGKCYNDSTTVSSLKQMANWLMLCEQSGCLNSFQLISQHRILPFTWRSVREINDSNQVVQCHVRASMNGVWCDLPTYSGTSFLRVAPNLTATTSEQLIAPADFDVSLDVSSMKNPELVLP